MNSPSTRRERSFTIIRIPLWSLSSTTVMCMWIHRYFFYVSGIARGTSGRAIGLMLAARTLSDISQVRISIRLSLCTFFRKIEFMAMIAYMITQIIAGFVGGAVSDGLINDGIISSNATSYSFTAPVVNSAAGKIGHCLLRFCILCARELCITHCNDSYRQFFLWWCYR